MGLWQRIKDRWVRLTMLVEYYRFENPKDRVLTQHWLVENTRKAHEKAEGFARREEGNR